MPLASALLVMIIDTNCICFIGDDGTIASLHLEKNVHYHKVYGY